jgi:C-terminal processing protease CtpA/Prc
MEDNEAYKAGVRGNDVIMAVNSCDASSTSIEQLIKVRTHIQTNTSHHHASNTYSTNLADFLKPRGQP